MGLILLKGLSTNSGHYISMVNVGVRWFECDDVKITKIEFNHFCNSDTVHMLFYKRRTWWKHLRCIGLDPMDATTCWQSWGEGITTLYSTGSSWRPLSIAYFHSVVLPFWFISLYLVLFLVSPDDHPVLFVLDLHMKYTVEVVLYIEYCVVCYHVIAAPYVTSVVMSLHTVTLWMMF